MISGGTQNKMVTEIKCHNLHHHNPNERLTEKMELKVWVDGVERIVCGVNVHTSCHDVILALAVATNQTGRFTLSERWRDNER